MMALGEPADTVTKALDASGAVDYRQPADDGYETVDLNLDDNTLATLRRVADRAKVTLDQLVSALLSLYIEQINAAPQPTTDERNVAG